MNIRIIVDSELKTTAAQSLDIKKDLEQKDQSLEETLRAYENKKTTEERK